MKTEHISSRVDRHLAGALEARARAEGRSVSSVVADLLAQAVREVPVGKRGEWRRAA